MSINILEDICSITDLKRNTRDVLDQVHRTKRPVILTVNGRADLVLLDAKTFELHLRASNLSKLLMKTENNIAKQNAIPGAKQTEVRLVREFFQEFTYAKESTT